MDLRLDGLNVALDGVRIVHDLTLDVPSGSVVGLLGPNGSGKTTALRAVYRALSPESGAILVDGADLWAMHRRDAARTVAALTQQHHTYLDFTVAEIVAMGRHPHHPRGGRLSPDELALCRDAMARVDVAHLADRGALTLSGGEMQRVLLARALVQEPRILVLDEPTNHLDLRHQLGLLSLIAAADVTVLVVLHDLNLAAAVCDRIAVLQGGALAAVGTPHEVLTAELLREVFGVDAEIVPHPHTGRPQVLLGLPTSSPMEGIPK
ncbi:ABC transporter ATP-binding protein [Glycomyces terrestris]|uniref:ABC transporter ATP-binding protein n=1 Tax=Glycomyces terrestris TaxID=2493553 RepID=A0A426V3J7_9ACTN|nr:ABC transporter ATP-binding protein [Glycomyces terrestris]RRS01398.1 ABC transporter ATP-binding protein [Glycomyces terrestris]